jgi:hypothetical protein
MFCQETTEACLGREKPTSVGMEACQETTPCHEVTVTDLEKTEPKPGMMQSMGEHQEVPKEEAAVMPVGGLKKQRRDRNLAAGHRKKPKKKIQASFESRRRLTVAGRMMTRRAGVAWCR